ncbi:MAG: thiol peroxidase [Candidatus Omnitrophica bacterium]|nr:thiol peroxidase [Candidatus Omnitrophota bacterium]
MERKNAITMKGSGLTLLGDEVKPGARAANFTCLDKDLKEASLDDLKGKVKLIASVPSLDTPVCDTEIKRFNDEAAKLSDGLVTVFISMDLPFAQKRFCQDNNIKRIKTFSDHRTADFGMKYGVLIKEMRLLARAIFIIDKDDILRYVQLVPELSSPPDYDKALAALKDVIKT